MNSSRSMRAGVAGWRLVPALLAVATSAAAQLSVSAVQPAAHAIGARADRPITVSFSAQLDRASVNAATLRVFGRWSGVVGGRIAFANGDRTAVFTPARPFFPGERVAVSLSSAVKSSVGQRLSRGYAWFFVAASSPGTNRFRLARTIQVRRANERKIRVYGAYAGDIDGDGAPDLTLPNEDSNDVRVLHNDGCGAFTRTGLIPLPSGSVPSPNEGADFDGDGKVDLVIGNTKGRTISVLINDGVGGFRTPVQYAAGLGTRGIDVLDADADGDDDVIAANRVASNVALYLNRGDGTFAAARTFDSGDHGETGVAVADADNDGVPDLFVANHNSKTVTLLLGNGAAGFRFAARAALTSEPWMVVAADVDGDGNADAVTADFNSRRVTVVRGDGRGGFQTPASYAVAEWPIAVDLADWDADGDLDLVASCYRGKSFDVLLNDGKGAFTRTARLSSPRAGSCALLVDYDRDGDVDIVGIDEEADVVLLFEQVDRAVPGAQPRSCFATLRVAELGHRAGFGGVGAHPAPRAGTLFLGVSGEPNRQHVIVFGTANPAGLSTPYGLFNVRLPVPFTTPPVATDRHGEVRWVVPIPPNATPGLSFAIQAGVLSPGRNAGVTLSNPEQIVIR